MVAPFPPPVTKLFLRVPLSHLQKVACQIAEWTLSLCSTEFDCQSFFCKDEAQCSHICFMHGVWNKSCFQFCLKSVPRPWSSRNDLIHLTTSITKIEKVCLMKRCKTVEPFDQNYLQKSMITEQHEERWIPDRTYNTIWYLISSCPSTDKFLCSVRWHNLYFVKLWKARSVASDSFEVQTSC